MKTGEPVCLEKRLVALLSEAGKTVCCAESCTGGMIAARLVGVEGASAVFPGALVSYATRVKEQLLQVSEQSVRQGTAVCAQVAREMALGACRMFGTDFAVSVTGLAGPGGGTEEIPVGRVYIACASGGDVIVSEHTFAGDRECVRRAAADAALLMLAEYASAQLSAAHGSCI